MSTESDPRIRRIKHQMLEMRENLQKKSQSLDQCQMELDQLGGWETILETTHTLPKEALDFLDIATLHGWTTLTLRLRLAGVAENVRERREGIAQEVKRLNDTLKKMEICPECSGAGKIFTAITYERLDEGAIVPSPRSRICNLCAGNGKIGVA